MTHSARTALVAAALAALVAGCGGGKSGGSSTNGGKIGRADGISVGNCLNEENFIVQPNQKMLDGTSPGGVSFTLTLFKDAAAAKAVAAKKNPKTTALAGVGVVDFRGNPSAFAGAPPAKVSKSELAMINTCILQSE